jgi:hypothetical protein
MSVTLDFKIAVFRARAEVRAILVETGELARITAIDDVHALAQREGLYQEIGTDAVQAIMAEVFESVLPQF